MSTTVSHLQHKELTASRRLRPACTQDRTTYTDKKHKEDRRAGALMACQLVCEWCSGKQMASGRCRLTPHLVYFPTLKNYCTGSVEMNDGGDGKGDQKIKT